MDRHNIAPVAVLVALVQNGRTDITIESLARATMRARGQLFRKERLKATCDEVARLGYSKPGVTPAAEINGVNPAGIHPCLGDDEIVSITDAGWESARDSEVGLARHFLFGAPLEETAPEDHELADRTDGEIAEEKTTESEQTAQFYANLHNVQARMAGRSGRLDGGGLFPGW